MLIQLCGFLFAIMVHSQMTTIYLKAQPTTASVLPPKVPLPTSRQETGNVGCNGLLNRCHPVCPIEGLVALLLLPLTILIRFLLMEAWGRTPSTSMILRLSSVGGKSEGLRDVQQQGNTKQSNNERLVTSFASQGSQAGSITRIGSPFPAHFYTERNFGFPSHWRCTTYTVLKST